MTQSQLNVKSDADRLPDQNVADFWDHAYANFDENQDISGALDLPDRVGGIVGKDVLIVACGTGKKVVRAAREARSVTAIDISRKAGENARAMVRVNGLSADFAVCDAAKSGLQTASFDLIWGSAVLHHLNHTATAAEFSRLLRPGGKVVMMGEPTFFNPLLKWSYEFAFGEGRSNRWRRFLIFTRVGDDYEKPIDHEDLVPWKQKFAIEIISNSFMFIEKIGHVLTLNKAVRNIFPSIDRLAIKVFPKLKSIGYEHDFVFTRLD